MSGSFTWNDIDFGGDDYKCFIAGAVFPMLGKPRLNLMDLSAADGAVSQGSSLGPLYFRMSCVIDADSEEEREACFWNVIDALSETVNGEAWIRFDHIPGKKWMARLADSVDGELAINGAEFPLVFVAPDPTYTVVS